MRGSSFLRWTRSFLFITGALALSHVALILFHAELYEKAANTALAALIQAGSSANAPPPTTLIKEGDVLGRIEIPRLGMMVAILQGTSSKTLQLGVGHIQGTALPGEPGNIGIAWDIETHISAASRTFKSVTGSEIQTAKGLSRYEVDWIEVVAPSDIGVLAPSGNPPLLL